MHEWMLKAPRFFAIGIVLAVSGCAGREGRTAAQSQAVGPLLGAKISTIDIRGFSCERACPAFTAGRAIQAVAASLKHLGWQTSAPPIGPDGRVLGGHEADRGEDVAVLAGAIRLGTRAEGSGRSVELTLSAAVSEGLSGRTLGAFVITKRQTLAADSEALSEAILMPLIRAAADELSRQIGPPGRRLQRGRQGR